MNDRDTDNSTEAVTGIDSDRTDGSIKKAGGTIKEGAGKLFGDDKLETEGKADQAEGKVQNAWGGIKDKAREITGNDDA